MKYREASLDRIFVIRLEQGEKLPDCLEAFCQKKNVIRGFCLFLGGVEEGNIVAGPVKQDEIPLRPIIKKIKQTNEILALGTIFPNAEGIPKLHAHASLGRKGKIITGCIRLGIYTWRVMEIILLELKGECGKRLMENDIGLELLNP
jgi:predicted DNA-binding protein with PD1-like motif